MRHKIVHDYFSVDLDLVWDVAIVEVPALLESLDSLLPEEDHR